MTLMRNAYKIFVGKRKEKIPFGRPCHREEGNIKIDLKVMDLCGSD
jgi:hypothetical protein